jgi:hypothetical protein
VGIRDVPGRVGIRDVPGSGFEVWMDFWIKDKHIFFAGGVLALLLNCDVTLRDGVILNDGVLLIWNTLNRSMLYYYRMTVISKCFVFISH